MKKVILSLVVLATLSVGISSCNSCQTCTYSGGVSIDICKKDYPNGTYDAAITAAKAVGYTCTKK